MSLENVRKFEEKLNQDDAMRARLQELSDAFDGDRRDSRAVFEAVISPLAAEMGLPYTYDEALAYVSQEPGGEDLDADAVKAVAGGNSGCFILGYSEGAVADICSDVEQCGANVCAIFGIGFLYKC